MCFCLTFVFQQNQKLKQELLESQTNIAFLQSELDSLKSDLTDQSINFERYVCVCVTVDLVIDEYVINALDSDLQTRNFK